VERREEKGMREKFGGGGRGGWRIGFNYRIRF